ncbi:FmdB family zinc ribbon protein [Bryobacter aggregatus]|uniref:FmdB family zinc ribbon protein n=1 Tax=Bryobacter aggregatus TaxID=360054 RepID=UPI0004E16852|nr:zinc ribbon domain-containing protein [Bryobacter aggregatus]
MPIYEYSCEDCGSRFEKLIRRPADQTELACPKCTSQQLTQEYSSFAARVPEGGSRQPAAAGGCPAGMCQSPGLCGRN